MDRRQRKTRDAIFRAFIALLAQKHYSQITVEQIISAADVGRATFYAHFETKDYLLKDLCRELFDHVFAAETGDAAGGLFACDASGSAFLHLFRHLQNNDNHIMELLSSRNNQLFLDYFKTGLTELVKNERHLFAEKKPPELPESFWISHIVYTFTHTVLWWAENGLRETPETITGYFLLAV